MSPPGDGVRHHAIDSNQGQADGQQGKNTEQAHEETPWRKPSGKHVIHRADLRHSLVLIDFSDDPAKSFSKAGRSLPERRSRWEREMNEELRFHIEQRAEHLVESGVPRKEAMRRARLEFGGIEGY